MNVTCIMLGIFSLRWRTGEVLRMELKITCSEKELVRLIRELQKTERAEKKVVKPEDREKCLGCHVGNPAVVMKGIG